MHDFKFNNLQFLHNNSQQRVKIHIYFIYKDALINHLKIYNTSKNFKSA